LVFLKKIIRNYFSPFTILQSEVKGAPNKYGAGLGLIFRGMFMQQKHGGITVTSPLQFMILDNAEDLSFPLQTTISSNMQIQES